METTKIKNSRKVKNRFKDTCINDDNSQSEDEENLGEERDSSNSKNTGEELPIVTVKTINIPNKELATISGILINSIYKEVGNICYI